MNAPPENGGSGSHLTLSQAAELIEHLQTNTYPKAAHICAYVEQTYGVRFTVSGMTKWLTRNNFSYKKPKGTPAKANSEKQAEFIQYYEELLNTISEEEPVEFGDGVRLTMATKLTYGWIRVGTVKPILTTASRTRVNLMGSINLETMDVSLSHPFLNHRYCSDKHLFFVSNLYSVLLKFQLPFYHSY